MKKIFIHHPLFRLLSPFFSGTIVYLLILMVNNNIGQLSSQFLSEELYFCIGLAFLIQESSRLILSRVGKTSQSLSVRKRMVLQVIIAFVVGGLLVGLAVCLYYKGLLEFYPTWSELTIFVGLYESLMLMYVSLNLSHQFLHTINTEKLELEQRFREEIEADFRQFEKGVNPDLLFESLEALIVLIHEHKELADELIDLLSVVYRYILGNKGRELVLFSEELKSLEALVDLFNHLPYRRIELTVEEDLEAQLVPGSLLYLLEQIVRSTIVSPNTILKIQLQESKGHILMSYRAHERIRAGLEMTSLQEVTESYAIYTGQPLFMRKEGLLQIIGIPKLNEL